MSQIRNIENKLLDDLKAIAKGMDKLTDTELVAIARELDFFQELLDRGYTNAVNGLMEAYEGKIEDIAKEALYKASAKLPIKCKFIKRI